MSAKPTVPVRDRYPSILLIVADLANNKNSSLVALLIPLGHFDFHHNNVSRLREFAIVNQRFLLFG